MFESESHIGETLNEVPPFSVLDARSGYWQKRKRAWLGLGIRSELGRGSGEQIKSIHMGLDYGNNVRTNRLAPGKTGRGSIYTDPKKYQRDPSAPIPESDLSITSIFDPVLCELMYRWFCPPSSQIPAKILDPFAGGSVRGIVASKLGRYYTGIELRPEQVDGNQEQAKLILSPNDPQPKWIAGDIRETTLPNKRYDFILTCPPYYNLEQYSDNPKDLSNLATYKDFLKQYQEIINNTVNYLNSNRFAVFVVGNFRDKKGRMIDFVGDTIRCLYSAGMSLHNDAILVTPAGSLPMRASRNFPSGRRFGRTHQNVLVFYKGDPNEIEGLIPLDEKALHPTMNQEQLDIF